ncbi:MAG: hypothetical protein AAGE94_02880 [Acidobacteriota bacterium]
MTRGRKHAAKSSPRDAPQDEPRSTRWATRLARNAVLWLIPVAVAWVLASPYYNIFLTRATENAVRLTESPSVSRLLTEGRHHFVVLRTDLPTASGFLGSVRVTDTHFPVMLMSILFLAVPGVALRRRAESLSMALILSAIFHIIALVLRVKFIYATQLGDWSLEHYGPFARNAWGLAKHLADLPFKFGVPVALWASFFLGDLLDAQRRPAGR